MASLLFAIILGLALLPLGTAAAQEPEDQPGRFLLHGQVLAIEAPALKMKTPASEQTVLTDENTRFRVPGVETPSLSDVHVGDHVVIRGERQEDGSLLASGIGVVTKRDMRRNTRRGRVEAIGERFLTLATPDGELIIRVNERTRYRIRGVEDPTLEDIHIGDVVMALGRPDGRGHWIARVVAVIPPERIPVRLKGEVTAVQEDGLTLDIRRGEITVLVNEDTRIRIAGTEEGSLADIRLGDRAMAVGRASDFDRDTHTLLARLILVRHPPAEE